MTAEDDVVRESPTAAPLAAAREHAPMSGIDEYLVHNYPHPVRVMWTSDAQAYERVWFTCQDQVGDLLMVCGLGFYPNLGTAEAFAIVNVRGRHSTGARPPTPGGTTAWTCAWGHSDFRSSSPSASGA